MPVPATARAHRAPRIRTRLAWRRDRLAGLAIGATLCGIWVALVLIFSMVAASDAAHDAASAGVDAAYSTATTDDDVASLP